MTYKEAMEYPYLVEEIVLIKGQLAELEENYYKIAQESTARELHSYNSTWNSLNKKLILCEAQCEKFEKWLSSVQDQRLQTIMFMRFVDHMTWAKIGAKMNCKPPTARKAVQRYMEKEAKQKHEN